MVSHGLVVKRHCVVCLQLFRETVCQFYVVSVIRIHIHPGHPQSLVFRQLDFYFQLERHFRSSSKEPRQFLSRCGVKGSVCRM